MKETVSNNPVQTTIYGAGAIVILANMVGIDITGEQAAAILFAAPLVAGFVARNKDRALRFIREVREAITG